MVMGIKEWSKDDRPREKLLEKGPSSLSNAELLAILINNGTTDKSAVEVTKELLQRNNHDLKKLSSLSVKDILQLKIKGIGTAKAVTIVAALELGIRRNTAENEKTKIKSSADIALFLQAKLAHLRHEVFGVVYLNKQPVILHFEIISEGGMVATIADPRIIFKKALANNATAIIVCHNHPSGNLQPSKADEELTLKLKQAGSFLDITVLDHIIVSEEGYYSFADEGKL